MNELTHHATGENAELSSEAVVKLRTELEMLRDEMTALREQLATARWSSDMPEAGAEPAVPSHLKPLTGPTGPRRAY